MRIGIDARKIRDFGIGTHIQQLLAFLPEVDADNTFIVFHSPGDESLIPPHGGRIQLAPDRSPKYSLRELTLLPLNMRRQRLDLFHAPHYTLPPVRPCKGVVTIHDVIHLRFPEYLRHPAMYYYAKWMMRAAAASASAVLTVSECSKQDIMRYLGVPAQKIVVIYNGIESAPPETPIRREAIEARFGLRQPYLLYLGNFMPHKNLETLVEAFRRLKQSGRFPYSLVLAGKNERLREQLQRGIAQADLAQDVRLTGFVEPEWADALYRHASAFVYPSRYEGFGLQALEAMARGVPVIVANAGALPEIAGDAALRFDPNAPEELAQCVRRIIEDDALRTRLIDLGRERARQFSWREMARKTAEVYRRVLSQ